MTLSKVLLWRVAVAVLAVTSLGLAVALWMSGRSETADAFASGKRVLIDLKDGSVRGNLAKSGPTADELLLKMDEPKPEPPKEEEPKTEPAKKEEPEAEAPKPEDPKPEAPVTEAPVVEEPKPQTEPPPADAAAPEPAVEAPKAEEGKPEEPKPETAKPEEPKPEAPKAGEPGGEPPSADEPKIEVPKTEVPHQEEPVATFISPPVESKPLELSATPLPDVNMELTEKDDDGLLPVIGPKGTKAWRYYAKAFDRKGSQPMIAIVVTGLGHNKLVTEDAMRLPENISLSFSPYARDVGNWGRTARLTAHEALLDLPMQPGNYPASDPGPYGLLLEKGVQENEKRMQWVMGRFPTFIGFLTPQNESYSSHNEAFKVLLQSVANRGLMLVVGREPPKSETKEMIETSTTPIVVGDTLIDEELTPSIIQSRLVVLEQTAKKRGYAIGIAQAYPITLEQLRLWIATLEAKGIALVPVSAVARLRFS